MLMQVSEGGHGIGHRKFHSNPIGQRNRANCRSTDERLALISCSILNTLHTRIHSDFSEQVGTRTRKRGAMRVLRYYDKRQLAFTSWNPPEPIVEISRVPAVRHTESTSLQPGDPDPVPTRDPADVELAVYPIDKDSRRGGSGRNCGEGMESGPYLNRRGCGGPVSSPPASLNLSKNPSQADFPSGHRFSVTRKSPSTPACSAIRISHSSTSTHRLETGCSGSDHSSDPMVMDVNAGADEMEHRRFVRRGEGQPAQSSTSRVSRADKDGIWTGGSVSSVGVSGKIGHYRVWCLEIRRNHAP